MGITACCPVVEPWAALIIGALAGPFYILMSRFTIRTLGIDDPLDATPVHMFCGSLGLILTAFFANPKFVRQFNSDFEESEEATYAGIFYGGNGSLLLAQIVEILVILAWVGTFITPYFYFLKVK